MKYYILFSIIIALICVGAIRYSRDCYKHDLLNIYGESLKQCKQDGMSRGSWDAGGKCSEQDGGVHQICIQQISKNAPRFSKETGQSDWSDARGKNNHCVCLGAWSLYSATQPVKDNILQCDAIPETVFSKKYVHTFSEGWNKWNGLELDNQIIQGVESLVHQCQTSNKKQNKRLIKKYCSFATSVNALRNTNIYKQLCKNIN